MKHILELNSEKRICSKHKILKINNKNYKKGESSNLKTNNVKKFGKKYRECNKKN